MFMDKELDDLRWYMTMVSIDVARGVPGADEEMASVVELVHRFEAVQQRYQDAGLVDKIRIRLGL